MKKKIFNLLLTITCMLAGSTLIAEEGLSAEAKSIFNKKCSTCHSIERPKSKKKTEVEWRKTVMRMKDVNGCPITDEEAEVIIQYLGEKYGK